MRRTVIIFLFGLLAGGTFSQGWMRYLPEDKVASQTLTWFDYQDAFRQWCYDLEVDPNGYATVNGEKRKAYGWKAFKRWEIEMEGMYDITTGEIYKMNILDEYAKYRRMYGEWTDALGGDWQPVAYTQEGSGNHGNGRINCTAFHPSDPDTYWIGTPWGGIWVTEDNGASWTPLSDNIGHIGIGSIAIPSDYATSHTIYLGTGDRGYNTDWGVGLLKSTDEGATWQETELTKADPESYYVNRILILPSDDETLYAGTSQGIYFSVDAGETWLKLFSCWTADLEFKPGDPQTIYASTRKDGDSVRVYLTTDGGYHWTKTLAARGYRMELAISEDDPSRVYALVSNEDDGLGGVYESMNSGASFTLRYDGSLPDHNLLGGDCTGTLPGGQGGYDLCIAANPLDADEVYVGGINVWKSSDHGISWTIVNDGYHDCNGPNQHVHVDQHWLEFHPSTNDLFVCNDGGIYYSDDDGASFENISGGLMINQPYRVAVSQQDGGKVLMGMQDNGSALWESNLLDFVNVGDGNECRINALDDDIQYTSCNDNHPVVTLDNWATAQAFNIPGDSSFTWFKPIILDPPSTVYTGYTNIWKSTDHGQNFSLFWDCPDTVTIRDLAICDADPDVMYTYNNENFYRTEDGGANWQNLTANLPFTPNQIYRIEVSHSDPDLVWVSNSNFYNGGVYRSADGGATWTDISDGLPTQRWFDLIQNDLQTGYDELYVCGFFGVFVKLGAAGWLPYNDGLPNLTSFDLDIHYDGADSKLVVGTHGRGVWQSSLFSVTGGTAAIWTGSASHYWGDVDNWLYHQVPGAGTTVIIPAGCANYPEIHAWHECNNLKIESGAILTLYQSTLQVNDSLTVQGAIYFWGSGDQMAVQGPVEIRYPGSLYFSVADSRMLVYDDFNVGENASCLINHGTVVFKGSKYSYIDIDSPSWSFNNITLDKSDGAKVGSSESCLSNLVLNGTLTIPPGNEYHHYSAYILDIKGSFVNDGIYKFYDGTFRYSGITGTLNSNSGCYFNDFMMYKAGSTLTLAADIVVNGGVNLGGGALNASSRKITVKGNWTRNNPNGSFIPGTGRVLFTGNDVQQIMTSDTFNIIELNKSSQYLKIGGANVQCARYDWTAGTLRVEGGSFKVLDLYDDGIFGNYILTGGTIDLANAEYIDLNGFITISGGTFYVRGGFSSSDWPSLVNAGLTMDGGILDFTDRGINLKDNGLTFTDIITGGVIRTAGGFSGDRHDFNPAGGCIEIYGEDDVNVGHGIGSSLYSLKINKLSGAATVISTLDIDDDVEITSGELDIGDEVVDLEGDLRIQGMLTMTDPDGGLHVGRNVQWGASGLDNVTAGNIYFGRNWSFGDSNTQQLGGSSTVTAVGDTIQFISFSGDKSAFKNLVIDKPSDWVVFSNNDYDTLNIRDNLEIRSGNIISVMDNCSVVIDSVFLIENDGIATLDGNGCCVAKRTLQMDGTMNLVTNAKVLCHKTFTQSATGHLVIYSGSFIIDAPYTGTLHGFGGTTDLNGGNFEITNDGIQLGVSGVFHFNGGNMRIGWVFKAIYAGSFQPSQGTVELIGNRAGEIQLQNGNYFHNLSLVKGSTYIVYASQPFTVNNDLTITSGTLNTMGSKLTVNADLVIGATGKLDPDEGTVDIGGDWTNNRGANGFAEAVTTVNFIGNNDSYLNNDETFYTLNVNKPGTTHKNLYVSNSANISMLSNLNIIDGSLKTGQDNVFDVAGNLTVYSGAGFDADYVSNSSVIIHLTGNWTDNNTTHTQDVGFNAGNSTVNFIGSAAKTYSSTGGNPFFNLTINKPSGSLNIKNNLAVSNDFIFTQGTLNFENANTVYEFKGDINLQAHAVWTDNTAEIRITGGGIQHYVNEALAPVSFRNMLVDMAGSMDLDDQLLVDADISFSNDVTVDAGELVLGGHTLECGHQLQVNSGGWISALDNSIIKMGVSGQVILNGGSLELYGADDGNALLTRMSTGYYSFLAQNGGTLHAGEAIFEYMDADGIAISATGLLGTRKTLIGCTFRNGAAGGALLAVQNSQVLEVHDAIFPENTWGGSYNVAKTNTTGKLTFVNESGAFAGSGFERDPNSLVYWSLSGRWTGLVSNAWNTPGNWYYNSVPDANTVVYIPASAPYMPWVNVSATVMSLTQEASANLRIRASQSLTLSGYASFSGDVQIDSLATLSADSIALQAGSSLVDDFRSVINLNGGLTVKNGALLDLDEGYFNLLPGRNGVIINQADTAWIFILNNQKTTGQRLIYDASSTGILTVRGNFTNQAGAILQCDSPEEIIFEGRFRNLGGYFRCGDGTITLAGNPYYDLRMNDGSYFNHLTIKTLAHLKLNNTFTDSLVVNGVLKIEPNPSGTSGLEPRASGTYPAMPVIVRGNWVNNVGTAGFVHGNGKVEFCRVSGHQEVYGHTQFYKVYERTSGSYRLKFYNTNDIMDSLVVFHRAAVHDTLMVYNVVDLSRSTSYLYLEDNGYVETELLAQGGHLVANSGFFMNYDLTDDNITGDYQAHGGSISLTQNESSPVDLNASVFITAGEFWIYGGNGTSHWPGSTGSAYLRMAGGVFGFSSQGVFIASDNFTEAISGGTIKTVGDFQTDDILTTFHPEGGTVELYGNSNTRVSMFGPGCHFWNLKISKGAGYEVEAEDYVRIKGELRIASGKFRTAGQNILLGP